MTREEAIALLNEQYETCKGRTKFILTGGCTARKNFALIGFGCPTMAFSGNTGLTLIRMSILGYMIGEGIFCTKA